MTDAARQRVAARTQYYEGAVAILAALWQDAPVLAAVAARAAKAIRTGHRVYANITTGHMPSWELVDEREGNPGFFEFNGDDVCSPEQFAAMVPGDVLLTNHVGRQELDARERHVYVVVFTTCYYDSGAAPDGAVVPNESGWLPADVASQVVDTHVPWGQGLVRLAAVPEMAVLPGSSIGSCAAHWAITAETAQALATGARPEGCRAREYLDTVLERLEHMHQQDVEATERVAAAMAERIISGGHLYVRSRNPGVQAEASRTAQGLVLANAFQPRPANEGGDRDVMLIAAVSADHPAEVGWAEDARSHGNQVVGIGQPHSRGLRQRCQAYFDNRCPEPGGVVAVPGSSAPVCPVTGIANNVAMHMLEAEFIDQMCGRGAVPRFLMGGYRTGSQEYNRRSEQLFAQQGY